ncbi:MAG: hypothetical protein WBK55_07415 [Alphaproteobacteria bacterium]
MEIKDGIILEPPSDKALLAAVGRVARNGGLLDLVLGMTIKTLTGVTVDEALLATQMMSSKDLRKRIKKLAKERLGDGPALVELEAILQRAQGVMKQRNELIHGAWVKKNGKSVVQVPGKGHFPLPTTKEVERLAQEIRQVYLELNDSRLRGSLLKALDEKKKKGWG